MLVTFATVVVREKLDVYWGGVYAGGDEVSSVLDGMTSEELGTSVDDWGASEEDGISEDDGASDEDGTSEVESAALLEGSALEEGELEGAGVSLLSSDVLDEDSVSLLDSGVLDGDGDSLLEGSGDELGGLPELLEGDSTTVVASAVEVTIVGERVTVGVSTDTMVD